jgi:hypothetical protein
MPEDIEERDHNVAQEKEKSEDEIIYEWAYANKLTTIQTFEEARTTDAITRAEMAKMLVVFSKTIQEQQLQKIASLRSQ